MTGRRLFLCGGGVLVLTAVAHTMGHFSPRPTDAATLAVDAAMTGYRLDLGLGMRPSLTDVQQGLSLTMAILTLALGVVDLVVGWGWNDTDRLRRLALVNLMAAVSLALVYWVHRVPPPLVSYGLAALLFLAAVVTIPGRSRPT